MRRWMILAFASCLAATAVAAGEIRLTVQEPAGVQRQQWPVTSGIPLAQGALRDDQAAALFDAAGGEVPLQTETLARWPDGSVRWLLLDFQIDLNAKETKTLVLRYGSDVRRAAVPNPVRVARAEDGKVTIEPGPVRLEYDPQKFFPQGTAWLTAGQGADAKEQRVTINCGSDGIALRDEQGQHFSPLAPAAVPAEIQVEQAGPVRACIRVSGWHGQKDARLFHYVARIHAWRGQPYVRVFYTFENDCQETLMAKIRKLELRFWNHIADGDCLLDGKPMLSGRLFQVDENQYLIDDKSAGQHGCGWAAVGSDKSGIAVGVREFWQNWPKAINCGPGHIGVELCPELPAGLYDGKPLEEENKLYYALRGGLYTFKVGVAKTHELWVNYFAGKPDAQRLGTFFQAAEEPLLAVAEPAYVSATKAAGDVPPADPQKFAGYDDWLSRALERHLQRRDKDREYGLLNYGDWFGERGVNWGNLEYDLAHGMFVQYLRTGDRRYFLRGEQAARHHIDVDVIHAVNPLLKNPWGPPPQVGEIWLHCLNHTGGYYENAPLPVDRTYQMGHSTNFGHVWVGGDFEYYYLTGDRRALEVAVQMADAMVRHCPTAYGDHIRGTGLADRAGAECVRSDGRQEVPGRCHRVLAGAEEEHRLAARLGRAVGQGALCSSGADLLRQRAVHGGAGGFGPGSLPPHHARPGSAAGDHGGHRPDDPRMLGGGGQGFPLHCLPAEHAAHLHQRLPGGRRHGLRGPADGQPRALAGPARRPARDAAQDRFRRRQEPGPADPFHARTRWECWMKDEG